MDQHKLTCDEIAFIEFVSYNRENNIGDGFLFHDLIRISDEKLNLLLSIKYHVQGKYDTFRLRERSRTTVLSLSKYIPTFSGKINFYIYVE